MAGWQAAGTARRPEHMRDARQTARGDPGGAGVQFARVFCGFSPRAVGEQARGLGEGADEAASLCSERAPDHNLRMTNELCRTLGANAPFFLPPFQLCQIATDNTSVCAYDSRCKNFE